MAACATAASTIGVRRAEVEMDVWERCSPTQTTSPLAVKSYDCLALSHYERAYDKKISVEIGKRQNDV